MAVEGIIANGVVEILKKLSSVVANEITLVWDFKNMLKNLQNTLNMILAVMEDAEKKQLSSALVRVWMQDLKAKAYDAEDILDEYHYEVINYKSTFFNKVQTVFSSSEPSFIASLRLTHKFKKINEKFNNIAESIIGLGLQIIDVGSSSSHELMMKNRVTDSLVVTDWKFAGRKNDKSNIINMLLEEEENSTTNKQGDGSKSVSVVSIVGMGGLGKTAMAQQLYNDEAVHKHFPLKVWICVSDPFDIQKLWNNIAASIGLDNKNDIALSLQKAFQGKKFLLVLDDVWNENHADWNNFKKPFMGGREGSKILVTTRERHVALIMVDKFKPYPLGILEENDCLSLFKEIAFGGVAAVETPKLMEIGKEMVRRSDSLPLVGTPKLMEIGKEMVKRCGGLPLAVVFLGGLMRSKETEEEWKIIRDTKVWHESRGGKNSEILPSLRLSYHYLPSHLKLCFSYCCLFPKDFEIHRETLIRLWMAEGFLIETPEENTMSMEEIGNEYFHSLLSSFFFQDVEKDETGDVKTCKMHDLVHDLASSVVTNDECLIVENADGIDYISEATRRLNLLVKVDDDKMLAKVLAALKKAKKLRTVIFNQGGIGFDIEKAFKENKRLRVLDLSGSYLRIKSTYSMDGLKHLRYFAVPRGEILFTRGIGRLNFLQTLRHFDVGDKEKNKNANGIEELEGLNLLRVLHIENLQNVTSGTAAAAACKEKKNLRVLNLTWDRCAINNYEAEVLEGLRPHHNLRKLKIENFEGSKLPSWIIKDSSSCLPNLVELKIIKNGLLTPITPTPTPTTTTIFPSLKVLSLEHLDASATKTLVTNHLNSLTSLTLNRIYNLVSLPRQLVENNNTLLSLQIEHCPQFVGFFRPDQDENEDDDGQVFSLCWPLVASSSSSSSSSALQSLKLYDCPAMRLFPNIHSLTSLRKFELEDCNDSEYLLDAFFSLQKLRETHTLNNRLLFKGR